MFNYLRYAGVVFLAFFILGCNGGNPVAPPKDTTPPLWDNAIGVTATTAGDGAVTIQWGTATDADSPPVEYLLYMDSDNNPWDQNPIVRSDNTPYTFTGLVNDQAYWFGVRCRDSADPSNVESNTTVLTTTPFRATTSWVKTFGGPAYESCADLALDSVGNIYIAGNYSGTVDFDPGAGEDIHTSYGGMYLSKFDNQGNHLWTDTWGNEQGGGTIYEIAIDYDNRPIIAGGFAGTIDFDPGPKERINVSNGESDAFLCGFYRDGNWFFSRNWGSTDWDVANSVACDLSRNMVVTGCFTGAVDMDPDTGNPVMKTSVRQPGDGDYSRDIYMSKFNWSGFFEWAITCGSEGEDVGCDIAVDTADNIILGGYYRGTMDFDPGPGVDFHPYGTPVIDTGAFLCKFTPEGTYQWAQTWEGGNTPDCSEVIIDSSGCIYASGRADLDIDLDPGSGIDFYSEHVGDTYLSKFDRNGSYLWGFKWYGRAYDMALDNSNNVLLTGGFRETTDFDPGWNPYEITAFDAEYSDIYLSKYDPNRNFVSAKTWGSASVDEGDGLAIDKSGNIFVAGTYREMVNFDIGGVIIGKTSDSSSHDIFLMKLAPQ